MTSESEQSPKVSAVVPVLDGVDYLAKCLPPLLAGVPEFLVEVLVVDDGCTDGSAALARGAGARVIQTGGRGRGPAFARNQGAEQARGDVLLFVDADVVVADDTLEKVAMAFRDPTLGALYGSYDDAPAHRGFASLYMNLRHHHGHRAPGEDVQTFWSGLGAIRREPYLAVKGFDVEGFPYPSVEDIDLGRRLREVGVRIRRDPTIQGTHLKRWTWWGVFHTDVFRRAIPWARLMQRHPGAYTDLNVSRVEQFKAAIAAALLVSIVLAAFRIVPSWVLAMLLMAAIGANLELVAVFRRGGGALFAVVGLLFHQLHFVYSGVTYVWCSLRRAG